MRLIVLPPLNVSLIFFFLRILTNVQFVRGRRRSCKAPSWFAKRRVEPSIYRNELTADNAEFVREVILDKYADKSSPLKEAPWPRNEWQPKRSMRGGLLAIKIGTVPQWTKDGRKFNCTMLQVIDNHVIRYTPPEVFTQSAGYKSKWKGAYGSLVVGALSSDPQLFSAQYLGLFKEAGVPPKRKLTRFLISPECAIQPGTPLSAMHFKVGDYVDVQAKTIGHGFQGVVKRWGFKGGPASHGPTKFQRRPGSIGSGRKMSRVMPGKKLPGHMGMDWNTLRGLKIWRMNTKYNVLYVMGGNLPGPNHCYVRIYDSQLPTHVQQRAQKPPPMPTFYPELDASEPIPEEIFDDELFEFTEPSIVYEEGKK
ncbi:hypothetical protein CAPTEDRAFT_177551 [Capitella teleta]|uniref:Large ribosomal subunit protein uL3m n=1 Tax=Capitella teleta TaxID=283909 RepID=R7TJR4_CAPTE|nr:hypothetical protein CAPTEDRAFT_177551 [Capitella teleta]|eukprot:ELT91781.1 hypothetical protein CAPTEDRAFT_177551 [Capitella teleta]